MYNDYNNSTFVTTYRIKQVDIDRRSGYSVIKPVKGIGQPSGFLVFPNPSSDGEVHVVLEDQSAHCISVVDMHGRIIKKWNDYTDCSLTLPNLAAGMYIIKIDDHIRVKRLHIKL